MWAGREEARLEFVQEFPEALLAQRRVAGKLNKPLAQDYFGLARGRVAAHVPAYRGVQRTKLSKHACDQLLFVTSYEYRIEGGWMVASMCVKMCEHTPGDGVLVGSENDSNTSCVVYNLLWEPSTFGGVESVGTVFCHTFLLSNG